MLEWNLQILIWISVICIILLTVFIIISLTKLNRSLDQIEKITDLVESLVGKVVPMILAGITSLEGIKKGVEVVMGRNKKIKKEK